MITIISFKQLTCSSLLADLPSTSVLFSRIDGSTPYHYVVLGFKADNAVSSIGFDNLFNHSTVLPL